MPTPKDGTPGSLVAPTAPEVALEADEADPGQVEELKQGQHESKTGKYGSAKVKPFKKATDEGKDEKKAWIEVVLVDDAGDPVPGEAVEIEMADGSKASGTTDDKGLVRVDGLEPGSCKVSFPRLDKDAWEPA